MPIALDPDPIRFGDGGKSIVLVNPVLVKTKIVNAKLIITFLIT
jgi:hypothetical protein